jgi:hypothetical protein
MILHLSRWVNISNGVWAWVAVVTAVGLWWLLLWGVGRFLIQQNVRPGRVVILARLIFFLSGLIFIFNLAFIPVVLVAFHGVATVCLGLCMLAALLYLLRVDDRPKAFDSLGSF